MILEELRSQTKNAHKSLEETSAISKITCSSFSIGQYTLLLKKFYGFILPVEQSLLQIPHLGQFVPDYRERLKAPLLIKDLEFFGKIDSYSESFCPHEIQTVLKAFGYLYVLEGSTLGGKIISEALHKNLGLTAEQGAAYFNNYQSYRGEMWKKFISYLSAYSKSNGENEIIVASAVQTFKKLELWINQ